MLARIKIVPASSGHQTHNQILYKFSFICQLASKSASPLNDRKGCGTGQMYYYCMVL